MESKVFSEKNQDQLLVSLSHLFKEHTASDLRHSLLSIYFDYHTQDYDPSANYHIMIGKCVRDLYNFLNDANEVFSDG